MGIVKWLAKRYAVQALNDLLEKHKQNVAKAATTIALWIGRLQKIVDQLNKLNTRISDGVIEDKEVDDTVKDIEQLIKEF